MKESKIKKRTVLSIDDRQYLRMVPDKSHRMNSTVRKKDWHERMILQDDADKDQLVTDITLYTSEQIKRGDTNLISHLMNNTWTNSIRSPQCRKKKYY